MYYVGVDLGQKHDHTAVAVVEKPEWRPGFVRPAKELLVRRVERVALGTPYPRIVEMLRDTVRMPGLAGRCALVVDGTGVGAPVLDMLRARGLGCEITAVTITGGDRESRQASGWASVPKRALIAGLQLAMEKGELRIARRSRDAAALVKELMDVKATANGGFGAEGRGRHDDLVIAVALACWRAGRRENGFGAGRLPGLGFDPGARYG